MVVIDEETIDGRLEVNDRVENAAFQATLGEFGEEAFDGIQEADELLMTMALHAAAGDFALKYAESSKQGSRAVAFVVAGHCASPAFLQGQTGLGAVQRLNLAFLIEGPHDGVGWWIDIKPDNIMEFVGKPGVIRQFELPVAMRLQPMRFPDAAHWTADMMAAASAISATTRSTTSGPSRAIREGRVLIMQQTVNTFGHEALLPTPDAGFRLACLPHDCSRPDLVGGQQNDRGAPDMFLGGIAIPDHTLKAKPVRRRNFKYDPCAHNTESHRHTQMGIPKRTLLSDVIQ